MRAAVRAEIVARPPGEGPELARDIAALGSARARVAGLRALLDRREDPTLFARDKSAAVRARAMATGRVAHPVAVAALADRNPIVRAWALEQVHDAAAALRFARDRAEPPRIAACRVLGQAAAIRELLRDRSWRVRLAAVRAVERLRDPSLLPALFGLLEERPGRVRARTVVALESLTRLPFGIDAARWRKWWARNGEGYELPPPRAERPAGHSRATIAFRRLPVHSRRLCFVLDASRSMNKPAPGREGHSRWELVVRDVGAVLERLPSSARFNVVLFKTGVEAWKPRLAPASRSARRACLRWVEQSEPSGWTNLYDALAAALEDDDVDALYVLTDGVPSRGRETTRTGILDEIALLNHYRLVQINCVQAGAKKGLGKRWHGFLDDLARAHEGVSVRE